MNTIEEYKKRLTATGQFEFFGLKMSQIPETLIKISVLLQISSPTKIIEFGTGYAGLSVLFNLYAKINKINFISYDVESYNENLVNLNQIDFRKKDLREDNAIQEIKLEIASNTSGRTILVCDALKSEEAKMYAPILKKGDIILVHDYSYLEGGEKFKHTCQKYHWTAPQEQWFNKFGNELAENKVHPLFHDEFEDVLWFCGIKNE